MNQTALEKLWEVCQNYITNHKITCEESICQVDDILLDSPDFIEHICDIVGYYNYPEDED